MDDQIDEARFGFLLEPIRDLSKNWAIDIAAELEEYLDEIEDIHISFDAGKTNLNFAEAALLIQGSACVYSRKVEYLYSLVFQTLDFIQEKKRKRVKATMSQDVDDDLMFEAEPEWLTLDDKLEISEGIDLVENTDPNVDIRAALQTPAGRRRDHLVARTPATLLDLDDEGDIGMSMCAVHPSGALVLDKAGAELGDMLIWGDMEGSMGEGDVGANDIDMTGFEGFGGGGDGEADDDDENDNNININADGIDLDADGGAGASLALERVAMAQANAAAAMVPEMVMVPIVDPWAAADPHDASAGGLKGYAEKPYRKGNTVRARRRPKTTTTTATATTVSGDFLRGPLYASEFSTCYLSEAKRRAAVQRKAKARSMSKANANTRRVAFAPAPLQLQLAQDTGLDIGGGFDDDDIVDIDIDMPAGWDAPPLGFDDGADMDIEGGAAQREQAMEEMSYEQLCRVQIDTYMRECETFLRQTALQTRVKQWHEKIGPVLEAEAARKPFNVDESGNDVLQRFPAEAKDEDYVPFSELVSDTAPVFSVARSFFAVLQLANDGSVMIEKDEGAELHHPRIALIGGRETKDMLEKYSTSTTAAARAKGKDEEDRDENENEKNEKARGKGKGKGKGRGRGRGRGGRKNVKKRGRT